MLHLVPGVSRLRFSRSCKLLTGRIGLGSAATASFLVAAVPAISRGTFEIKRRRSIFSTCTTEGSRRQHCFHSCPGKNVQFITSGIGMSSGVQISYRVLDVGTRASRFHQGQHSLEPLAGSHSDRPCTFAVLWAGPRVLGKLLRCFCYRR